MGKHHQQDCKNKNGNIAGELENSGFWIYVSAARIRNIAQEMEN